MSAHAGRFLGLFELRPGRIPDAHLPRDYRLGRAAYKSLKLYDVWLRGTELQADDTDYDDPDDLCNAGSMCDADRVSWLLNCFLTSHLSEGMEPPIGPRFDARKPASEQIATLLAFGFDAPPMAGWLLSDMVAQQKERAHEDDLHTRGHLPPPAQRVWILTFVKRSLVKPSHVKRSHSNFGRSRGDVRRRHVGSRATKTNSAKTLLTLVVSWFGPQ